ncbi:right-handed parallel beta-helix repeat-containing protein [Halorubrum laminariae]|uniref:Right-handed parallel beta-helix repeat-containing protein n=1 Tax=Halorubrum laminariae TaxID=1433523 RepID=A0ABD6BZG8_9EURY|nr:right-handed parallel beta-helix repeat-containing protein [Halorubrum laminariae]
MNDIRNVIAVRDARRWWVALLVGVALVGAVAAGAAAPATAAPASAPTAGASPDTAPTAATHDTDSGVTFVESPIATDTTWSPADGPYRIIRSVEIEPGATLTIEPGTDVQLAEGVTLTVRGSLRSDGTADRPVTLRRTAGTDPDHRWESLRYEGGDDSRLALHNTTLRGGSTGVDAASDDGAIRIVDSTLEEFATAGVGVTDATPTAPKIALVGSTVRDVDGHAIDVTPSTGAIEAIELTAANPTRGQTTRNTLTLDPGAGVSTNAIRLRYPADSSVRGVNADTIARIGIDADRDGDVDRSLAEAVTNVSVDGRQIEIRLSRTVRLSSRDRLLVEYGGVENPPTRGVYPVDVNLLADGVPQLSDGVRAAYVVGEDADPSAGPDVEPSGALPAEPTRASGLTVADSTLRDVAGAGVFAAADTVTGVRVSETEMRSIGGDGVAVRADQSELSVRDADIQATDAGLQVDARTQTSVSATGNRLTGSSSGIRIRQSERRERLSTHVTLRSNTITEHARSGVDIRSTTSQGELRVVNNTVRGNGRDGLHLGTWAVREGRIAGNDVRDNGDDGIAVESRVVTDLAISENDVADSGAAGIAVRTRGGAYDLSIADNTVADGEGHGVAVTSDLLIDAVDVAGNRLANNGGAGLLVSSPITHNGTLDATGNVVAANAYGIVTRGAVDTSIRRNEVVFNTNAHADPVAIDGVDPGTGVYVAEGDRGAILDGNESVERLEARVANSRVRRQITLSRLWDGEAVVVLRTDGVSHARAAETGALDIRRVTDELPTAVGLTDAESPDAGVQITDNDIYGHPRGLTVDVEPLVAANVTARYVTDAVRTVDAESNYWGADTGPYHASILPEGDGDRVVTAAGWVDFVPFRNTSRGERYVRPTPRLNAPERVASSTHFEVSGANSTAGTGGVGRYHFYTDGTALSPQTTPTRQIEMPDERLTVELAVEDTLGIDSAGAATTEVAAATSETAPSEETPETPQAALGSVWGVLGAVSYLLALVLGGHGMIRTLASQRPPVDGITVQGLALAGVAIWLVAGVLGSPPLVTLGIAAALLWAGLTGVSYLVVRRLPALL